MLPVGNALSPDPGKARADFVLGDRHGASCDPAFTDQAAAILKRLGFTTAINDPYAGAYIVSRHGRPAEGRHSLQIEINRGLYLDLRTLERSQDFAALKQALSTSRTRSGNGHVRKPRPALARDLSRRYRRARKPDPGDRHVARRKDSHRNRGAAGIGHAIAERFVRDGARVVIADLDAEKGARVEKDLGRLGQVRFVKTDVARKLDVHNLVAAAIDGFGDIDVLVNNAGIVHGADFLDLKEEDFDRVLAVNLKGAFLAGQAVAQVMVDKVKAGGSPGAIVNMSSINAVFAIANQVPYSISKGGVSQLTKVMALSLAPYGSGSTPSGRARS